MSPASPTYLIATCFGIGNIPIAPGTFASIATLPFVYLIEKTYGSAGLLFFGSSFFVVGCYVSGRYAKLKQQTDPSSVVIDEVSGQILTFCFIPITFWSLVIGFLLFRAFDIFKPWPINIADKRIKGGFGIMIDDMLAAGYASFTLYVMNRFVWQGV